MKLSPTARSSVSFIASSGPLHRGDRIVQGRSSSPPHPIRQLLSCASNSSTRRCLQIFLMAIAGSLFTAQAGGATGTIVTFFKAQDYLGNGLDGITALDFQNFCQVQGTLLGAPSQAPSDSPTSAPSAPPTGAPVAGTPAPSSAPTGAPTEAPVTPAPTRSTVTVAPTMAPSTTAATRSTVAVAHDGSHHHRTRIPCSCHWCNCQFGWGLYWPPFLLQRFVGRQRWKLKLEQLEERRLGSHAPCWR